MNEDTRFAFAGFMPIFVFIGYFIFLMETILKDLSQLDKLAIFITCIMSGGATVIFQMMLITGKPLIDFKEGVSE